MKINFREKRKQLWLLNCILFNITRFVTPIFRTKKLWVFGANTGWKYEDNSMYLFEYVNSLDTKIETVWLTRNDDVVKIVRSKGYEAYNVNSRKGISKALRAGVVFYTAGLTDFGLFPLVGGAKIISLWHGVGFKKIYNEAYSGISLKLKQLLDFFFSWTYRNIAIATSDYSKKKTIIQFGMKKENVYITGQPRNDVFKTKLFHSDAISDIQIPEERRILLYMPTYRWSSLKGDIVASTIQNLYENHRLKEFLEKQDFIFIAKLHPRTKIDTIINDERFIVLHDENVISNQKLIAVSDIMLTDYSSCFIDFALLNRPIFFLTPDLEEYQKTAGGMDNEFFNITSKNRANDIKGLCLFLEKWEDKKSLEQTNIINDLFEDKAILESCYCENVYNTVINILKI